MASADEIVEFSVFEADSGRILRSGSAQRRDIAAQALQASEIVMEGAYLPDAFMVRVGKKGPAAVAHPIAPPPAPTAASVAVEAARRIEERYPLWRQLNLVRAGDGTDLEAMSSFIDAVRGRSNEIEAMTPIPADFADDQWWPT